MEKEKQERLLPTERRIQFIEERFGFLAITESILRRMYPYALERAKIICTGQPNESNLLSLDGMVGVSEGRRYVTQYRKLCFLQLYVRNRKHNPQDSTPIEVVGCMVDAQVWPRTAIEMLPDRLESGDVKYGKLDEVIVNRLSDVDSLFKVMEMYDGQGVLVT